MKIGIKTLVRFGGQRFLAVVTTRRMLRAGAAARTGCFSRCGKDGNVAIGRPCCAKTRLMVSSNQGGNCCTETPTKRLDDSKEQQQQHKWGAGGAAFPSIDEKQRQQTKDPFYFLLYRQLCWDLFVTRDLLVRDSCTLCTTTRKGRQRSSFVLSFARVLLCPGPRATRTTEVNPENCSQGEGVRNSAGERRSGPGRSLTGRFTHSLRSCLCSRPYSASRADLPEVTISIFLPCQYPSLAGASFRSAEGYGGGSAMSKSSSSSLV
jgi:hypothetical protein